MVTSEIKEKISREHPYEDACKLLKIAPVANYKSYKLSDETRNFIKLETVAKALNQGWKPDLSERSTVRHYPWAYVYTDDRKTDKSAGLLRLFSVNGLGYSYAAVGTSLEIQNEELCQYFMEICKKEIVIHLTRKDEAEKYEFRF